jgi:hypothetical protein
MADELWTTRDGTQIAVGDMDEDHVRNALRMILRKWREQAQRDMAQLIGKDENLTQYDSIPFDDPYVQRGPLLAERWASLSPHADEPNYYGDHGDP